MCVQVSRDQEFIRSSIAAMERRGFWVTREEGALGHQRGEGPGSLADTSDTNMRRRRRRKKRRKSARH